MTPEQRENEAIADTLLAVADDFLAHFGGEDAVHEAYDWLVKQAEAIRGGSSQVTR